MATARKKARPETPETSAPSSPSASSVSARSGKSRAVPAKKARKAVEATGASTPPALSAMPTGASLPAVRPSQALPEDDERHNERDLITGVRAVPMQTGDLEPTVVRPDYWEGACADLVKRDRILKKLIPQFGPVHLKARGDPFVTLARSIVGQQISIKAAQTVWDRLQAACPRWLPVEVVALGYERLASCGLSKRKAEYILDLAQHFVGETLHVDRWSSMDDEDVIAELTQIRGIGRWTAEMFLIFNLMRPDVLPLDDLGLIKAISVNYFSGEPVTRSEAREVAANWEPWRTVATWYMWRSLEPLPVVY